MSTLRSQSLADSLAGSLTTSFLSQTRTDDSSSVRPTGFGLLSEVGKILRASAQQCNCWSGCCGLTPSQRSSTEPQRSQQAFCYPVNKTGECFDRSEKNDKRKIALIVIGRTQPWSRRERNRQLLVHLDSEQTVDLKTPKP